MVVPSSFTRNETIIFADRSRTAPINTFFAIFFPSRELSSPGIISNKPAILNPSVAKPTPPRNAIWVIESSSANSGSRLDGTSQGRLSCAAAAGVVANCSATIAGRALLSPCFRPLCRFETMHVGLGGDGLSQGRGREVAESVLETSDLRKI